MPILDANLSAAHKEYMEGDISHGAFEYVRSRHETALNVISLNDNTTEVAQIAYNACALLAIDLRSGVKEVPDKAEAQEKVEDWWQCYRNAGFTDVHEFFNSPTMPVQSIQLNLVRETA